MNNKRHFRNTRTYAADHDDSSASKEKDRTFRRSYETSSNMDVSPETGFQNSQTSGNSLKRSFRTRTCETDSESKRSFRSHSAENWISNAEENDTFFRKTNQSEGKRSFRTSAYMLQMEDEPMVMDNPLTHNPAEETRTLLEELANKEDISEETVKILKTMAGSLSPEHTPVQETDTVKDQNTAKPLSESSEKKSKSAAKEKEPFSAALVKDQILKKVPFIKHTGGLYAYNGRTYVAINTASQLVGIVINQVDEKMFGLTSTNIFSSVLTMLQEDDRLIPTDYTERVIASENIVAFKNTLLDVRTLKKLPFNPWYITSYEIDANYLAHPDPDVYMDFLNTVSGGDREIADCITECISYILAGTNEGKKFFVLGQNPESGKSSLAKFLQGVINDKYVFNVAPHEFKDRFALGNSKGRILNISMDLPSTKLSSDVVSIIKMISGGDKIMTQEKNEKKEFGISSMRLFFGTNHAVSVNPTDDNDSFWSRLQVVPFTRSIAPEDKDPYLVQKLLDERDDIVSYCIQKMPEIISRGYQFSPCQAAEDLKNEWRYGIPDDDSLESFCDTYLEITGDTDDVVLATDIYIPYREFCKTINVKPLRDEKIKEWFNSHGGSCERKRLPGIKNAQSVILGIRLRKEYRELAHEDVSDEDINEVYEE